MDILAKMESIADRIHPTPVDKEHTIASQSSTKKMNGVTSTPTQSTAVGGTPGSLGAKEMQLKQPDPDSIKMFVGQIPRSNDENDLREMFEEFGEVYQINVLRDKVSGQSKGCCFVTFYTRKSALDAQNELHNLRTLPGMHHPIQMKPADSENRNERKLFLGMMAKKCNETDIRVMFSPYGTIEECTVLRDSNGQSKGCAFVTYASRQCAINAIRAMHHSQTMEGCSSPLVVKFADTQKEKDQKRMQGMSTNLWNVSNMNLPGLGNSSASLSPHYLALLQQAFQGTSSGLGGGGLNSLQQLSGLNSVGVQQLAALAAMQASTNSTTDITSAANLQGLAALANMTANPAGLTPLGLQGLVGLTGTGNTPQGLSALHSPTTALLGKASGQAGLQTTNSSNQIGVSSAPVSSIPSLAGVNSNTLSNMAAIATVNGLGNNCPSAMDALTQAYSGVQQYTPFPSVYNQGNSTSSLQQATSSVAGKQIEGPEGANLFIYHLPQEFGDNDLAQTFMPFGNVISAKVFIDKQTNLSKCFGFVSYDNPVSAVAAIQAMNGFQIGMKRLKVQLKRSKEASKPY